MATKKTQALQTQIAAHEVFGQFRYIVIDGEIYFVGKDVAKILGYKDTKSAIIDHVDDEDKVIINQKKLQQMASESKGGVSQPLKFDSPRGLMFINESGLYSLIFGSQLPTAKKFTRWVTSEVLPQIRKTGSYHFNKNSNCDDEVTWDGVRKILNDLDAKGIEWDFEIEGWDWIRDPDGTFRPTYKIAVKVNDK